MESIQNIWDFLSTNPPLNQVYLSIVRTEADSLDSSSLAAYKNNLLNLAKYLGLNAKTTRLLNQPEIGILDDSDIDTILYTLLLDISLTIHLSHLSALCDLTDKIKSKITKYYEGKDNPILSIVLDNPLSFLVNENPLCNKVGTLFEAAFNKNTLLVGFIEVESVKTNLALVKVVNGRRVILITKPLFINNVFIPPHTALQLDHNGIIFLNDLFRELDSPCFDFIDFLKSLKSLRIDFTHFVPEYKPEMLISEGERRSLILSNGNLIDRNNEN